MVKKSEFKTFGETVGAHAFPDAEEVKLEVVLGTPIIVKDAAFKMMQFGEVAILLFSYDGDAEKKEYSVLVGGQVVRDKVKEAKAKKLLPLIGTINHDETYYDIV